MVHAIWHILLELAPWMLIGALGAGALHALLPEDFLRRHLTGRWAVAKAAALGVPMSLCSCSVIPVGLSIRKQGASAGATVAFLITTPESGVDAVMVSAGFLGWPFAIFKLVSAFVIGLTGGVLTDVFVKPSDAGPAEASATCEGHSGGLVSRIFGHAIELLQSLWGWLVIGVLASAAIEYFLPAGGLERFNSYGGAGAMAIALVIGMPLYVCATASVPIAAALIHGGFPPGAALVFLIAGPATNITTMGAVYRTLGRRTLMVYLATIAVGSIACGLLFDGLIHLTPEAHASHDHTMEHGWPAVASAIVLLALFAKFAWEDARRWMLTRGANDETDGHDHGHKDAGAGRVEVAVDGMTCGNCVAKLERVLGREAGVSGVAVTLQPGRAVVHGDVSEPRVRELIAQAGFQPR